MTSEIVSFAVNYLPQQEQFSLRVDHFQMLFSPENYQLWVSRLTDKISFTYHLPLEQWVRFSVQSKHYKFSFYNSKQELSFLVTFGQFARMFEYMELVWESYQRFKEGSMPTEN